MRFKKILAAALVVALGVTAFAGCGSKKEGDKKMLKIGIIQHAPHPALDAAREGFIDGLKKAGYVDGENIKIKYENASAEVATGQTIADTFANDHMDLILAIATPSAQAVAKKIKDVPILVTAVTDPADAGLVNSNDDVGGNVTGTSDLSPVKAQIEMIPEIKPDAKTVGILYCSAEDNSKLLAKMARDVIEDLGMKAEDFTVQNTNDVQSVVESMVGKVDVIYAPTDNIISSSMSTVSEVATKNKIPIIAAEEEQVKNGALCTKGLNYFKLGEQTAEMAVKILKGEKTPAQMPIEYQKDTTVAVNEDVAKKLGINNIKDLIK